MTIRFGSLQPGCNKGKNAWREIKDTEKRVSNLVKVIRKFTEMKRKR